MHAAGMQRPSRPEFRPARSPLRWPPTSASGDIKLRGLLADGYIRRVVRGVYVANAMPDTVATRAQAAALVISPAVVLCDRSAAWLHGVDVLRQPEHDVIPTLDTYVLPDHVRANRPGVYGGQRDLAPSDIVEIADVRVTSPSRTALDLGCALSRRDALAALDAFMRAYNLSRDDLLREVPRYFRRRGVRQLRGLTRSA